MKRSGAFRARLAGGTVALLLVSGVVADIALSSLPAYAINCTVTATKPTVSTDGNQVRANGEINCGSGHALTLKVTLQRKDPSGWTDVTSNSFATRNSVFLGGSSDWWSCPMLGGTFRSKASGTADNVKLGTDTSNLSVTCQGA